MKSDIFFLPLGESGTAVNTLEEAAQQTQEHVNAFQQYLNDSLPKLISFGINVIIAVIVFLIGSKIIKVITKYIGKRFQKKGMDAGIAQFLYSFIKVCLYVLLILLILAQFGVTTASVIAILGSSGLTLGLALQGSLSNFAGGVLILIQKPFTVGDYIIEDTHKNEGTVARITLTYTTLTTIDNRSIVIPNGTLANTSLVNVTHMDKRMLDLSVGVSYDADLKQAKEILRQIAEQSDKVLKEENIQSFVSDLGDSSIQMGLRCWVKTADYWPAKWEILEEIKNRFTQAGIEIPYPQMTVSFADGEHS